jgi:hypothetical protein
LPVADRRHGIRPGRLTANPSATTRPCGLRSRASGFSI